MCVHVRKGEGDLGKERVTLGRSEKKSGEVGQEMQWGKNVAKAHYTLEQKWHETLFLYNKYTLDNKII